MDITKYKYAGVHKSRNPTKAILYINTNRFVFVFIQTADSLMPKAVSLMPKAVSLMPKAVSLMPSAAFQLQTEYTALRLPH